LKIGRQCESAPKGLGNERKKENGLSERKRGKGKNVKKFTVNDLGSLNASVSSKLNLNELSLIKEQHDEMRDSN